MGEVLLEEYKDDFGLNLNETQKDQSDMIRGSINPYLAPEQSNPAPQIPRRRVQETQPYPDSQRPQVGYGPNSNNNATMFFDGLSKAPKDIDSFMNEGNGGCLKNMFMGLISILVIVASFGASFYVGKKIFLSDKFSRADSAGINFRGEFGQMKSKIKSVKNKLIISPDYVTPRVDEELPDFMVQAPGEVVPPEVTFSSPQKINQPALAQTTTTAIPKPINSGIYRVIAGKYSQKAYAEDAVSNLKTDGFPVFIFQRQGSYLVQIGAFREKDKATKLMQKAISLGYNAVVAND